MTVFYKISVRRSINYLEFFYSLRKAKNFKVTDQSFLYNFPSLSLRFSEVEVYAFHPRIYAIFRRKRKAKIFRFEEELEKFSFSQNCKLYLKFWGKQYWSLYNFEKVQVVLGWTNRYRPRTNLIYVYICRHAGVLKQWVLLRSSSLRTIPYFS